ncbi:MAG: YybH family protein, partial [Gemmatimonadales bacterium]
KMYCFASKLVLCSTTPTDDPEALLAIIAAIETGWETGSGELFYANYLDFEGARYVESGGQNEGLADLVENHVVPEGEALELQLEFTNVETRFEGSFAWAVADVDVQGTVRSDGRQIHLRGYETFLFRYVEGEWKVVHTHSSTRPVRTEAD